MDPSRLVETVQSSVDSAMDSVSVAARALAGEAAAAGAHAESFLAIGKSHTQAALESVDSAIISTLKEGIVYGMEHQIISTASISAVVLLTAFRRSLYRATLGRFVTAEQLLKNKESSVTAMLGDLNLQKNEIQKLAERLTLAREEYVRGKAKLNAAAKEMRSLESRVGTSERKAKDLLSEIREIRAKGSLQLRSDAAVVVEAAKTQRRQVEKIVWKLDSHGI